MNLCQLESQSSTVTDANWESWRVKFKAYADLANMGARLDVAAESRMMVWTGSVTISKTVHALLIMRSQGKALTLVSLVP